MPTIRSRRSLPRCASRAAIITALLLLVPLLAMRFSDEVDWSPMDFAMASVLLFGAGFAFELAIRNTTGLAARVAIALLIGATLLLVWANLAVGILGNEDNPANVAYFAVPLIGIVGAALAHTRPRGMAATAAAMAVVMVLLAVFALFMRSESEHTGTTQILLLHGLFAGTYLVAAGLLQRIASRH